ncbi:uncharacterized protein PHACADRAFT_249783 [Phanerochaete carnosa HHB-10118-sp]|uniref:Golgi apparatus membrane protein TVP38 n=1 Tax=Phanerochaete carnosa (strain HHB-10118-sp) TaxID=650164 RepID=K5WJ12_PHACS|nr:uncharacterized protein PHACADRAFT_249783 [Phanerochaete carnosa HHB-10118-sp]EKM59350.1 hypothetical protein PHACADRAFT_249783 [Phanerochaete carnosa HHB-10118-sp]
MEPEAGRLTWLWTTFKHYVRASWVRYKKLPIGGKMLVWSLGIFYAALGTFLILGGAERLAQALYNFGQKINHLRFGWMILAAILVIISVPPFIGHTTTLMLCGFCYGMKGGFFLAAGGSIFGAAMAFVVLRLLFNKSLRKWSSQNEKWQALEAVIRARGLPLIMLIRASPFPPWVYANALFASIETVALWQFVVASVVLLPKISLYVFIGTRLAVLSDGTTRKQMDTLTKVLNGVLVGVSFSVAIIAGLIIFRSMKAHIRHLEGIPPEVDELAAEALEEASEGAPLLGNRASPSSPTDEESNTTVRPGRAYSSAA